MSQRKLEASEASQNIMVEASEASQTIMVEASKASQNMGLESAWVEKMLDQIEMYRQSKPPANPSIFKVHPTLRSSSPNAYEPKLVSIGPYHHGKSNLQAMEEMKWRLLDHLLSKAPEMIHLYLKMMQDMEEEARSFYSEVIVMESHKFAEMLLLDGYFIIQLFIPHHLMAKELQDLLDNSDWFRCYLLADLLFLVENQIPCFILERLLCVLNIPELENFDLQNAIRHCICIACPLNLRDIRVPEQGFKVAHILHLLHELIMSIPRENKSDTQPAPPIFIPSATELLEAGVKIEKSEAQNFLDISFNKGVLKIPAIGIYDSTNLIFRNLIALEQFYPDVSTRISSYSMFMDCIINTESDVAVLGHEKIIHRGLGNNTDIANVFNGLCKEIIFPSRNYLDGLCREVDAYCNRSWHRWRARLMHDYFGNPWAIISVIAAAILLVLTFLQAILSILSYKQQIYSTKHQ